MSVQADEVRTVGTWPVAGQLPAQPTRARLLAGRPFQRLIWVLSDASERLREGIEADLAERRGFLWLPVAFGSGSLLYFALPKEPLLLPLLAITILAGSFALAAWHCGTAYRVLALLALVLAGLSAAKLRVETVRAPAITRPITAEIEGRVVSREVRAERTPRMVLDRLTIEGLAPERTPARVRVTLRKNAPLPSPGETITLRARLMPVPGPALPGGYDARRAAFFERIGATGFVLGTWQPGDATEEARLRDSAAPWLARLREAIVARILAATGGEDGAIAAALLVGERGLLSERTNSDLRDSGLFHIISISGLHMALVAGTAFAVVRGGLALWPRLALTRPIRKWAALAALLVGAVYLALSGGGVATVRSYIMMSIMFLAILIDRPALSLRNLALAALVVMATEPESVAEPGFQMSFAAVMALLAAWEAWRERDRARLTETPQHFLQRLTSTGLNAFAATALTTLVASAATAPFALYHFQRVVNYALLGNLLATPVISTLVMPFGLLALVLMPFGLEGAPLAVMSAGIGIILDIAHWVSSLGGAAFATPPMPVACLLLVTGGLIWLCLWRPRWRLLGVIPILTGLAAMPMAGAPPDMLISADGRAVAVRDDTGALRVSGSRAGSFLLEQWFESDGSPMPPSQQLRSGVACDKTACSLTGRDGLRVAHVLSPSAFIEDCGRSDVILTPLVAPDTCRAPLVIDRSALARGGAQAVRLESRATEMPDIVPDGAEERNDGAEDRQLRFSIDTTWPEDRRLWWNDGAR